MSTSQWKTWVTFFHRFFFLVIAVSRPIAISCPNQEDSGETACLDDSTQLRVGLPDPRPALSMALTMIGLHPWFPKGPGKAENCQPCLIQPHSQIRGQNASLCTEIRSIFTKAFTKLQLFPKIISLWFVNLGSSSYVQMYDLVGAIKQIDTFLRTI